MMKSTSPKPSKSSENSTLEERIIKTATKTVTTAQSVLTAQRTTRNNSKKNLLIIRINELLINNLYH